MNRREMIAALSAATLLTDDSAAERGVGTTEKPRFTESKVYQFADLPTLDRSNGPG